MFFLVLFIIHLLPNSWSVHMFDKAGEVQMVYIVITSKIMQWEYIVTSCFFSI